MGSAVYAEGFGAVDQASVARFLSTGAQLELDPEPASARTARAFVRRQVAAMDHPQDSLRENAELLASELVTNGVLHAGTPMTLGVVARDNSILLGVTDGSDAVPAEYQPSLSAEGGRGIALVSMIARQWGVAACGRGKLIWCLIDAQPG